MAQKGTQLSLENRELSYYMILLLVLKNFYMYYLVTYMFNKIMQ